MSSVPRSLRAPVLTEPRSLRLKPVLKSDAVPGQERLLSAAEARLMALFPAELRAFGRRFPAER